MFTVLIILLALVVVAVIVLLVRNTRAASWSGTDEYPPKNPPDI